MNKTPLIVVPIEEKLGYFVNSLPILEDLCTGNPEMPHDLLVIDDGLNPGLTNVLEENEWVRCIAHEDRIGFGGVLLSALKYARDFDYDIMLIADPGNSEFHKDISMMMENIKYGYDIVTCSRILENYDHSSFPPHYSEITTDISNALSEITDEIITDPLSGIKAFLVKSLENIDLTEFSHAALVQLWVQAAHFGLTFVEIPAASGESFGRELELEEDPLGSFLSVMETELYLYPKRSVN